ncbi:MAG: hypothetical protein J0G28_05995 [Afipia sp.]|nr:hypothetical protein [Afipia sp.]OJW63719.1 MAG: hypothetical protein BGO65_08980 [Afipia sp. 64-13]
MPADGYFLFTLVLKMAVAAGFVIAATVIAERAGAFIGSLIVTLPISTGPAYVFIALDHDAAFVARAALTSVYNNVPTAFYTAIFVVMAQRFGPWLSVATGLLVWAIATYLFSQMAWTLTPAILANVVAVTAFFVLVRAYREAPMPRLPLRWFDLLLRALIVSVLIAAVVTLSFTIGPEKTGLLASFPATFTATMLILHRRVGGKATAAVMAHSLVGLLGFGLCMAVLYLAAVPVGAPLALGLALLFSVTWNAATLLLRRAGVPL